MKALLLASLIASAAAGTPAVYNAKYVVWNNRTLECDLTAPYQFALFTNADPPAAYAVGTAKTTPTQGLYYQVTTALANSVVVNGVQGNGCSAGAFTGWDTSATPTFPAWVRLTCAPGFVSDSAILQVWGDVARGKTNGMPGSWTGGTALMFTGNETATANYDLALDTFNCVAETFRCNVTCTAAAAGGKCATGFSATASQVDVGAMFTPCDSTSATKATSTLNSVAITTLTTSYKCETAGDVFAFMCTSSAADIPNSLFAAWASQNFAGFTSSTNCNCNPSTVLTFTCAVADVSCPKQTGCNKQCTKIAGSTRQLNARNDALCAAGLTLAQTIECFRQAACFGVINPALDTCQISSGLNAAGGVRQPVNLDFCPNCNDTSKKGLLGLLGLLGLIPLLCLSLLCCLLLLSIRRKKAEGDVHFATFDAGAQPIEHCAPVQSHFQTVHTQTHVGAPHVDGGFGHPGHIVY